MFISRMTVFQLCSAHFTGFHFLHLKIVLSRSIFCTSKLFAATYERFCWYSGYSANSFTGDLALKPPAQALYDSGRGSYCTHYLGRRT